MTIFSTLRYSLLMALNLRLSLTTSGLLRATPRSSNRAFIASNLSSISSVLLRRNGKIKPLGMTYRKFKADYLFLGDGMADPDSVLITTDEGIVQAVVAGRGAGDDVEVYSGVLSPGFVNCHCHLELSHMKGVIPEGTGLVDFLSTVIRRRATAPPEGVAEAIAAGEQEMLDNGIMAVGD